MTRLEGIEASRLEALKDVETPAGARDFRAGQHYKNIGHAEMEVSTNGRSREILGPGDGRWLKSVEAHRDGSLKGGRFRGWTPLDPWGWKLSLMV